MAGLHLNISESVEVSEQASIFADKHPRNWTLEMMDVFSFPLIVLFNVSK